MANADQSRQLRIPQWRHEAQRPATYRSTLFQSLHLTVGSWMKTWRGLNDLKEETGFADRSIESKPMDPLTIVTVCTSIARLLPSITMFIGTALNKTRELVAVAAELEYFDGCCSVPAIGGRHTSTDCDHTSELQYGCDTDWPISTKTHSPWCYW